MDLFAKCSSLENVKKANEALNLNMPIDIITIYIKDVLEDLGEITGDTATEDILNTIFSKFCSYIFHIIRKGDYLYGENAIVNSIYPDDTNIDTYTFNEKQIKK